MLSFLKARKEIELYAPAQAVADLRDAATSDDDPLFDRVHSLSLEYADAPLVLSMNQLTIEAVRIPHSGWPNRMADIENIAFRVTLDGATTVTHLGDADTRREHFEAQEEHWRVRRTHMAFPPFWFLLSEEGRAILSENMRADRAVGVHVPRQMPHEPTDRPARFQNVDLFTRPGEIRDIGAAD